MKNESVSLNTLAERISAASGVEVEKVKNATNEFFNIITREILDSGSFKLIGFGTFNRMYVDETERKNSRTGETIFVPSHYLVKFVPSTSLAKRINKPYEHLKPVVIEEPKPLAEEGAALDVDEDAEEMRNFFDDDSLEADEFPFADDVTSGGASGVASEKNVTDRKEFAEKYAHQSVGTVIEHQVIQKQIIHQHIDARGQDERFGDERFGDGFASERFRSSGAGEHFRDSFASENLRASERFRDDFLDDDDLLEDDYESVLDDELEEEVVERYVNRCWFFAGIAVIITVFILTFCILVFSKKYKASDIGVKNFKFLERGVKGEDEGEGQVYLKIAEDDNLYAKLAGEHYGHRNLWPYIFSANMLRFPDPDKPGFISDVVVPSKPNKSLDRRDIELSVIDVYDAYRSLVAKNPNTKVAEIRKEHAVTALFCGESLYSGFIDKYAIRLAIEDVAAAREKLQLYEAQKR